MFPKAKESCIPGREGGEFAGLSGVGSRDREIVRTSSALFSHFLTKVSLAERELFPAEQGLGRRPGSLCALGTIPACLPDTPTMSRETRRL